MINVKEKQSIKDATEAENKQTQYSLLGNKNYLYFHEYKLAIEVDELGHNNRSIDFKVQKTKNNKKNLVVCLLELILMKKFLILLKP